MRHAKVYDKSTVYSKKEGKKGGKIKLLFGLSNIHDDNYSKFFSFHEINNRKKLHVAVNNST